MLLHARWLIAALTDGRIAADWISNSLSSSGSHRMQATRASVLRALTAEGEIRNVRAPWYITAP
jgi:hypothetical protein